MEDNIERIFGLLQGSLTRVLRHKRMVSRAEVKISPVQIKQFSPTQACKGKIVITNNNAGYCMELKYMITNVHASVVWDRLGHARFSSRLIILLVSLAWEAQL